MGEWEEMGHLVLLEIRVNPEQGEIMGDLEDKAVQEEEELQDLRGQQAIQDQPVPPDLQVFQDLRVSQVHKEYRDFQEA